MAIIEQLQLAKPIYWKNTNKLTWNKAQKILPITTELINDAEQRLIRFAPYFELIEPLTRQTNGLIESPLTVVEKPNNVLPNFTGRLLLKRDDLLPIAGSIKARGGIHEVIKIAEALAVDNDLIDGTKNYQQFGEEKFNRLFSKFEIIVGSTGNLGLSIGIMSAKLGFKVTVHMSNDAKQWKKELLRQKGANVVEHSGDYGKAVAQGRIEAQNNSQAFFIDDENSLALFSGYAVAARRLKQQLDEEKIEVSIEKPLVVYLPCGVGGGPGGVAYGLKTVFGDAVHCVFVEPVQSPCMLLGMATGKHHEISVQDIGLTNKTAADGLAVGTASKFVGPIMMPLLDGIVTVEDQELYVKIRQLFDTNAIKIEPSAAAALYGPAKAKITAETTVCWLTGGGMIPEQQWIEFYEKGVV